MLTLEDYAMAVNKFLQQIPLSESWNDAAMLLVVDTGLKIQNVLGMT
jgi:hypothetical protein